MYLSIPSLRTDGWGQAENGQDKLCGNDRIASRVINSIVADLDGQCALGKLRSGAEDPCG